ncbi:MAG: glycosyltransferase [Fusobacterium sp. JB019]|nr:glycosyltransferase [Fusobacterium sp. JB019]
MLDEKIKITMIIPVYNVEKYILECINSIESQSYKNIEILIINDGSTDNSKIICEELQQHNKNIRIINQLNGGVSVARNTGINNASGDYIIFIDSDDYWNENILEDIVKEIYENNFPDLIYSKGNYILDNGKLRKTVYKINLETVKRKNGKELLSYLLKDFNENIWSVCRGVYKKKIILKNKIYFKKGKTLGEDADWFFRFLCNSEHNIFFEKLYYVYRVNRKGSAMDIINYKHLNTYLDIVIEWINKYYEEPNELNKVICQKISNNYIDYFKYIMFYSEDERKALMYKIKGSGLFKFVTINKNLQIIREIQENKEYSILNKLNKKYKRRKNLKKLVLKFKNLILKGIA